MKNYQTNLYDFITVMRKGGSLRPKLAKKGTKMHVNIKP